MRRFLSLLATLSSSFALASFVLTPASADEGLCTRSGNTRCGCGVFLDTCFVDVDGSIWCMVGCTYRLTWYV